MGKLIKPEDIAETILFLGSEQAKIITGQVIKGLWRACSVIPKLKELFQKRKLINIFLYYI